MEKRVIVAVVLCVAVIVLWQKFLPPPSAPAPAATAPAPIAATTPAQGPATPASGTPAAGAPVGAPTATNRPEEQVELITHDQRFVLSSFGGTLRHAQLREARFLDHSGDPSSGHDIVRTVEGPGELLTTFPGSGFATPLDGTWVTTRPDPNTVVFTADTDTVRIEKWYRVDPARYRLHLDVVVRNKTARNQDHHLAIHVNGRQDPERKGGGFFSPGSGNLSSIICRVNGSIERQSVEKLAKDPISKAGDVQWIAADEKFFVLAAVPYPENPPRERTCTAKPGGPDVGEGTLTFQERSVPPGGSTTYSFAVFAGPKVISDLKQVQPGGLEVELDRVVEVTLWWLSRPILDALKFFHGFAHNWGVAIILLTVFIKLLTFYPTQKSLLSAKKMQKLAPKMNAIRKKYENDRQRQSVETMNLYKAHGVSPFGGCLPSLIQMPIWIALYSTLNYAVELYRAPFFGHIRDLTSKDPYYITPLLMGGVMFMQMKMSPSSPDNQQQAMMSVMMPVMFTAFSLVLPSGLALYMLTSYLIGILQQLYINHLDRKGATS
jgi:YidC/Oxa1 family membrane protein insertase